MTFGGRDPEGLGPDVERAATENVRYVSSPDVVELMFRVDELLLTQLWRVETIDRTNDGVFYAFLVRIGF